MNQQQQQPDIAIGQIWVFIRSNNTTVKVRVVEKTPEGLWKCGVLSKDMTVIALLDYTVDELHVGKMLHSLQGFNVESFQNPNQRIFPIH